MRDPARIPRIIKLVQKLWEMHPDQRFGQLIENYLSGCGKHGMQGVCVFHEEDDRWEKTLEVIIDEQKWLKELRNK